MKVVNVEDSYKSIATSIVEQAAKDYCNNKRAYDKLNGKERLTEKDIKNRDMAKTTINDVKKFFYSDWFTELMPGANGEQVYKQIIRNYNDMGKSLYTLEDIEDQY